MAVAQNTTSVDDPESTLLSDLVVIAPTEGPAWWRVSKGDAVVWIMGLPAGPMPKEVAWDRKALERRLKGANALLTPPFAFPGLNLSKREIVSLGKFLPGVRWTNGNVEKSMPPALAARFAAVRARIKKPVSRYATPIPATAFFILLGDVQTSANLDRNAVPSAALAAAKRMGVSVVRPTAGRAGEISLADVAPGRPAAALCYDAVLDSAETPRERYLMAAEGWARGDLRAAVAAPRDPNSLCDNHLLNQGAGRRSIEVQVAAIENALTKPGKTVALSQLRMLLADEGILDRLAAKGYHIIYPTSMTEQVD